MLGPCPMRGAARRCQVGDGAAGRGSTSGRQPWTRSPPVSESATEQSESAQRRQESARRTATGSRPGPALAPRHRGAKRPSLHGRAARAHGASMGAAAATPRARRAMQWLGRILRRWRAYRLALPRIREGRSSPHSVQPDDAGRPALDE